MASSVICGKCFAWALWQRLCDGNTYVMIPLMAACRGEANNPLPPGLGRWICAAASNTLAGPGTFSDLPRPEPLASHPPARHLGMPVAKPQHWACCRAPISSFANDAAMHRLCAALCAVCRCDNRTATRLPRRRRSERRKRRRQRSRSSSGLMHTLTHMSTHMSVHMSIHMSVHPSSKTPKLVRPRCIHGS